MNQSNYNPIIKGLPKKVARQLPPARPWNVMPNGRVYKNQMVVIKETTKDGNDVIRRVNKYVLKNQLQQEKRKKEGRYVWPYFELVDPTNYEVL